MAKKAELLEEAKALNLEVSEKNTIAEITEAIASANKPEVAVEENTDSSVDTEAKEENFTKAGKRSKKATEEADAAAAKEARKESGEIDEEHVVKKGPAPKTRTSLERRGKKYRKAAESIDKTKTYELSEAVKLVKTVSTSKFDGSIEIHISLNVDPKHADQNIRGSLGLPHGTGKTTRVAVFADDENVKKAKAAGADIAAGEEFLEQLQKGQIDFDVLVSTPQNMPKLGKFAKVLGPKGLMPNPKSGTVTTDIEKAVKEAKAGKVEYRVDKAGIVHLLVGKVSFDQSKLQENVEIVIKTIKEAKPASVKSDYIKSISLTPTMGPAVKVQG